MFDGIPPIKNADEWGMVQMKVYDIAIPTLFTIQSPYIHHIYSPYIFTIYIYMCTTELYQHYVNPISPISTPSQPRPGPVAPRPSSGSAAASPPRAAAPHHTPRGRPHGATPWQPGQRSNDGRGEDSCQPLGRKDGQIHGK